MIYLKYSCVCGAATWALWKVDQTYRNVLKCGAAEGRRKSVGQMVWEMNYDTGSRMRRISYLQ